MYFPVVINCFGSQIPLHAFTEFLAFFVGYRIYVWKKKKVEDPFTDMQRLYILVGAAIGALVFSRLIGGLERPTMLAIAPNKWIFFLENKTVAGGFLGGWLGVEITKYFLQTKRSSGDLLVIPMIIGLLIGRIGCFSQGIYEETYGNATTWLTGMDLGDGIQRHPLVLYEMTVLLFIYGFLILLERNKKLAEGMRFKIFMFLYLFYRFIAENMKPHENLGFAFTSIQWAILICYAFYLPLLFHLLIQPKNVLYKEQKEMFHANKDS